jgi:hypothetical protein
MMNHNKSTNVLPTAIIDLIKNLPDDRLELALKAFSFASNHNLETEDRKEKENVGWKAQQVLFDFKIKRSIHLFINLYQRRKENRNFSDRDYFAVLVNAVKEAKNTKYPSVGSYNENASQS